MKKILLLVAIILFSSSAYAVKRVESIRAANVKQFERVSESFDKREFEQAESILMELNVQELNNIERAYVYNFYGNISYQRKDLAAALEWFQKCSEIEEGVSQAFNEQIKNVYAQLTEHFEKHTSQYASLAAQLDTVDIGDNAVTDDYAKLARSAFELGKFDEFDALLTNAISVHGVEELPEPWLKLYVDHQIGVNQDYESTVSLRKMMIDRYPSRDAWMALVDTYFSQQKRPGLFAKNVKINPEIVGAYTQMYQAGFLDGTQEHKHYFVMLSNNKQYTTLVESYRSARNAGKFEETTELKRLYAIALFNAERWRDSIEQNTQLVTDDPRRAGTYWLAIGAAQEKLFEFDNAKTSYKNAQGFEATRADATAILKGLKKRKKKALKDQKIIVE